VSDVLVVDASELSQQLLRSLVNQPWQHEPHFDNEIAASAVASRRRTPLAQSESVPGLGPGGDPQPCGPLERRHVYSGAERRLVNRKRQHDVKVVAVASEEGVRLDPNRDVEIARLTATRPCVPSFRDTNAGAVGETRRQLDD
jgi:hypothetical protein